MSDNPYQPPTNLQSAVAPPADYLYRPLTMLTNLVSAMLLVSAFLIAVVGNLDVMAYLTVPGYATGDFELDLGTLSIPTAMMGAAIANGMLYFLCGITFLVWTYRATSNAHALGAQGMQATPGWAVGYWFIPIANLFKPYQAFCEVHRASEARDPHDWSSRPVPGVFPAWWFCWIVGGILSRIESRAATRGWDLAEAAIPLSVSSSLLGVASAFLAIMVIRSIDAAQQDKVEGTESF